jgi:hypothetical protein
MEHIMNPNVTTPYPNTANPSAAAELNPGLKAHDVLNNAAGHLEARASTYDKPEGERSMGTSVNAFNTITGSELTEEQGWLFMVLLKAVRSQQGDYKLDNYEDGAAYFALAAEAANKER